MSKFNLPVVSVDMPKKAEKTLPVNTIYKTNELVRVDMDDIIGEYDDGDSDYSDEDCEYDDSLAGYAITLSRTRNWQLAQDKFGYPILIAVKNAPVKKAAKGKK